MHRNTRIDQNNFVIQMYIVVNPQAPAIWKKMYNYDQVNSTTKMISPDRLFAWCYIWKWYIALQKYLTPISKIRIWYLCFPSAPLRRVWWWRPIVRSTKSWSSPPCCDSRSHCRHYGRPPLPSLADSRSLSSVELSPDSQRSKLAPKSDITQRLWLESHASAPP